ncbi:MAG: hypothetical protein LR011_14685 [Verrucomicrobia bacterium]|nr:hypothetical protein [Verrucomicrobiota bacterium]
MKQDLCRSSPCGDRDGIRYGATPAVRDGKDGVIVRNLKLNVYIEGENSGLAISSGCADGSG